LQALPLFSKCPHASCIIFLDKTHKQEQPCKNTMSNLVLKFYLKNLTQPATPKAQNSTHGVNFLFRFV